MPQREPAARVAQQIGAGLEAAGFSPAGPVTSGVPATGERHVDLRFVMRRG